MQATNPQQPSVMDGLGGGVQQTSKHNHGLKLNDWTYFVTYTLKDGSADFKLPRWVDQQSSTISCFARATTRDSMHGSHTSLTSATISSVVIRNDVTQFIAQYKKIFLNRRRRWWSKMPDVSATNSAVVLQKIYVMFSSEGWGVWPRMALFLTRMFDGRQVSWKEWRHRKLTMTTWSPRTSASVNNVGPVRMSYVSTLIKCDEIKRNVSNSNVYYRNFSLLLIRSASQLTRMYGQVQNKLAHRAIIKQSTWWAE